MSAKTETKDQNVVEFLYEETAIHFLVNPNDKNVMVNATEMAKLFDKRVSNFLRLDETKLFIEKLVEKENINSHVRRYTDLDFVYSNNKAGTFMHRKLALKFAAWLDIDFDLWIIDVIDEILFSKTEPIAKAVSKKQLIEAERKAFIEKGIAEQNPTVLAFLKFDSEIKKASSSESKAITALKNQYKMNI